MRNMATFNLPQGYNISRLQDPWEILAYYYFCLFIMILKGEGHIMGIITRRDYS